MRDAGEADGVGDVDAERAVLRSLGVISFI